jgi:hypothetical protein
MTVSTTVTTELHYFVPPTDGSKPYTHVNVDTTTGLRPQNWTKEPRQVEIENIRGREDSVSLDTTGFQYHRRPQKYTSFANDEEIEREYYPESIAIVKELTGASRIVPFDHSAYHLSLFNSVIISLTFIAKAIRRQRPGEIDDSPQKRQPVSLVHVDQTADSAVARVHRHLPASDVPELLKHRFQIINLWRPIDHEAWDWPLALCDYRSIDPQNDLVPTTLVYPDREGETSSVKYNPNHRWKYLKGMAPDEFVLIKWYVCS